MSIESVELPPVLLTPKELAARWGCSVGHLANMRSAKVGPSYLKPGGIRYRIADVVAYEVALNPRRNIDSKWRTVGEPRQA